MERISGKTFVDKNFSKPFQKTLNGGGLLNEKIYRDRIIATGLNPIKFYAKFLSFSRKRK